MDRPLSVYSVDEFVNAASTLLAVKPEFVRFVLCGQRTDGRSALLDPLRNRLIQTEDLWCTRDYDSILGIDKHIRVRASLTLYVVGKAEDVLRKNIHVTYSWVRRSKLSVFNFVTNHKFSRAGHKHGSGPQDTQYLPWQMDRTFPASGSHSRSIYRTRK